MRRIGNLQGRRRKEGVALVPYLTGQSVQGGQRPVNGIVCQLRVGDVALNAAHREYGTQ